MVAVAPKEAALQGYYWAELSSPPPTFPPHRQRPTPDPTHGRGAGRLRAGQRVAASGGRRGPYRVLAVATGRPRTTRGRRGSAVRGDSMVTVEGRPRGGHEGAELRCASGMAGADLGASGPRATDRRRYSFLSFECAGCRERSGGGPLDWPDLGLFLVREREEGSQ